MEPMIGSNQTEDAIQYVLWKKTKSSDGFNYFFKAVQGDSNGHSQQIEILKQKLKEASKSLEEAKELQLELAKESFKASLENGPLVLDKNNFYSVESLYKDSKFWKILPSFDRFRIFNHSIKCSKMRCYTMANLRCEIRDLQFDNDKLKIEKQKFVNLAEQGSLTEKKQLVELEDLCEQLLERERVIKELEIERDLMTTEFQEHIRNLQKKPLVSPDIKMEIDEVLETKCTKEIDEVLVTKCTKVDPENCLEAETGSASLIIKEDQAEVVSPNINIEQEPDEVLFNNSNSKLEQKKAKQKVHSKRTFNCSWPGCNRRFFQKFSLQKHSEFHISNKNIVCEFCFARFGTSIYMRAHLKKKHNIIVPARTVFAKFYNEPDVTTRPNKKLTKLLLCPHCDNKKFSFLASFNQHMKIHNTHHCKLCSASFSNQKYLNFHLNNTHFAAISCPIISCAYSSFNRFRYKAHLTKMHSQDDLYGSLIAEADRLRPNYKELKFCLETA